MLWITVAILVCAMCYLLLVASDDGLNQAQEDAEQAEYLRRWAQRKKKRTD